MQLFLHLSNFLNKGLLAVICCASPRDTIEHSGNGFGGLPEKLYSHRKSGTSSSTNTNKVPPPRPRRIILVRHGQSEGNVDESVYTRVSNPKIRLTEKGMADAEECGKRIKEMIEKRQVHDWKVYFYVSPYRRTVETLKGLGKAFERSRIAGMREEPRLREQDFGNFQDREKMRLDKAMRMLYGRFFYRFPNGESAADVYDRITGFRETLKSDIEEGRFQPPGERNSNINLVIVSHCLTLRVFLMRWYKWTVEQFDGLNNFGNGSMIVMERGYGGRDTIEHYGNGFAGFPQKHYSHKESGTSTSKTKTPPPRPRRIILVRHGQSEGNVDEGVYTRVSDPKIGLTEKGVTDAEKCGRRIREMIEEDQVHNWKVYFYVSPYKRAVDTLKGLGKSFERSRIAGMREEPRLREQDFGNFQDREKMRVEKAIRMRYGRFFYRFPNGESAADVYDRITGFRETLKSDIDVGRFQPPGQRNPNINLVIVSHGLTLRVFLMRWYKWTVEQYERLNNFSNGSMVVMERGYGGRYSLSVHHEEEELREFGLSDEMLTDQEWQKYAKPGELNYDCPTLNSFFTHFGEDDDGAAEEEEY
ncbi:uncharacterized protein LOC133745857 [Rosa rugosa]|uniref:uncharacterized protein LOC133745857 n=1 Tax=Rosa rugosa TaxID=74645 RepID=UPI002B41094C|nr:uncharacterized protein LOC133745857 [Rosa rugosa]